MATDINIAKPTIVPDANLPSAKISAENNISGINFEEIIRKSGSLLDNGINLLSDRAGITGVSERNDNALPHDDYAYDENDSPDNDTRSWDNFDNSSGQTQERNTASNTDYNDDNTQNYKSEIQEIYNDKSADNRKNTETKQQDDSSNISGDSSKLADNNGTSLEQLDNDKINRSNSPEVTGNKNNKELLSNLVTSPQINILSGQDSSRSIKKNTNLPGNAAEQIKTNVTNNTERKDKAAGLAMVASNFSAETNNNSDKIGQSGTKSQNNLMQQMTQNLSNVRGKPQSHNANTADLLTATGVQESTSNKANEQAAQLSKMVGNNKKLDISVTVTDEKSTLVSKPTANLSSNALLTADSTAASLRSQQGKGNGKANVLGQAQQASEQITGATGQLQQAVGTQTQLSSTASANSKGAANLGINTIGAQGNFSGNGEAPFTSAPNSINATQQAQHNTSTQAANSTRFTTANLAVVEQVSVQISKALNAGNDKISIQLKPADLGRVDVQLEVGHDGRVTAVVTADNKQTLDLLQKDSKQLQEALQQAGLQADEDSLSFNLREHDDSKDMAEADGKNTSEGSGDELTLEEELAGIKSDIITDTRVDVRA